MCPILTFIVREHDGAGAADEQAERGDGDDQVGLRGLRLLRLQRLPQLVDHDAAEVVHALSDAVEEHQAQGDAHHGVRHREQLPGVRLGRGVAVPCV